MSVAEETRNIGSFLFGSEETLLNLKCFTGEGEITEEKLRKELQSALVQRRNGSAVASHQFNDDAPKVDIRALIASVQPEQA